MGHGNFRAPFAASHVGSAGIRSTLQLQQRGLRMGPRDHGLTNEAVLERASDLTGPEFPVGTQYAYSGMGYVLLAMIVAIVSGQSFADFLKARIFDPLGINHTVAYDASRPAR